MNRQTTKLVEVVSQACALLMKVDFPIVDHQHVLKQLSESALFFVGLLFFPMICRAGCCNITLGTFT